MAKESFQPAGIAAEAIKEGSARPTSVGGCGLVLCRVGDQVYALANECTHDGEALGSARVANGAILCPRHGARFDVTDGAVLWGPAGQSLATYPVEVRDGEVHVRVPERAARSGAETPIAAAQRLALDIMFGNLPAITAAFAEGVDVPPLDGLRAIAPGTPFSVRENSSSDLDLVFQARPPIAVVTRWTDTDAGWRMSSLELQSQA